MERNNKKKCESTLFTYVYQFVRETQITPEIYNFYQQNRERYRKAPYIIAK